MKVSAAASKWVDTSAHVFPHISPPLSSVCLSISIIRSTSLSLSLSPVVSFIASLQFFQILSIFSCRLHVSSGCCMLLHYLHPVTPYKPLRPSSTPRPLATRAWAAVMMSVSFPLLQNFETLYLLMSLLTPMNYSLKGRLPFPKEILH